MGRLVSTTAVAVFSTPIGAGYCNWGFGVFLRQSISLQRRGRPLLLFIDLPATASYDYSPC